MRSNKNLVLSGILEYPEVLSPDRDDDYIINNTNLSEILRKIYFCDNNHIYIRIYSEGKNKFEEDGNLYLRIIEKPRRIGKLCLTDYFVLGENLESKLFELVGQDVEVTIYGEALFAA